MQANMFKRSLVAVAVAGAFATGVVVADRVGMNSAHATAAAANAAVVAAVAPGAATALPDFADLVAKHGPAVVQISVSQNAEKVAARSGRGMPDLGDMFPGFRNFPRPQMPDQTPTQGVGSGFIVSADGIILTNAHVVDDADEVTVRLTDKREFKAKVLGSDKMTDVAVLKIDAKDLPVVKIGNPAGDPRRRMGRRHRHAVRPRQHGDVRHRQRQIALAARRRGGAVHPDRRRGEPRQLRRPAVQPQRRSDRHQFADLQPQRRLPGPRVRDSDRRRDERQGPDPAARQSRARPSGRDDPGSEPRTRRELRPQAGTRARWSARCRRTAPPPRPASSRAT